MILIVHIFMNINTLRKPIICCDKHFVATKMMFVVAAAKRSSKRKVSVRVCMCVCVSECVCVCLNVCVCVCVWGGGSSVIYRAVMALWIQSL